MDGIVGKLDLARAVRVHDADLEVRSASPAHEDDARAVRGPGRSPLLLDVVRQARRDSRPIRTGLKRAGFTGGWL